ncbi:MAG: glycosyltransferase [Acidobacteriaceae bacterium]
MMTKMYSEMVNRETGQTSLLNQPNGVRTSMRSALGESGSAVADRAGVSAVSPASRAAAASGSRVAIVTSLHRDFDIRIWRHARLTSTFAETHLICGWAVASGTVLDGVTLHTFRHSYSRLTRIANLAGVVARLLPLLRRVDVIHFHDLDLLPVMIPLSIVRPVIYDVHENYAEEMLVRTWVPSRLRRLLFHLVHALHVVASRTIGNIVCVVPDQKQEFRHAKRLVLIENFASSARALEWKDNYLERQPAVISTAAQYPANGTWVLLDIAQHLQARAPQLEILAIDHFETQKLRSEVLRSVEQRGIRNIRFLPRVEAQRVMEYLNQATVGLISPLNLIKNAKGLPTKLFEYMAAGIPCVAGDFPHVAKVVNDSGCGILVAPEDVSAFVDGILWLTNHPAEAHSMGMAGRAAFLERYNWEIHGPKLRRLYLEVAGRPADSY